MTYKTGSITEFMRWTKRVITDPSAADAPKQWFDNKETAAKALGAKRAEALVKLLSEENMVLFRLIESRRPNSLHELAVLSGRKEFEPVAHPQKTRRGRHCAFRGRPTRPPQARTAPLSPDA